jgi:hypothetical protein
LKRYGGLAMSFKLTALITLLFAMFVRGFATDYRVVSEKNDFGGITSEFSYHNGDEFYNKFGIERSIAFYDYAKIIKKAEFYFLPDAAKEKGYAKRIEYYNDKGKIVSNEVIQTDEFSRKENYFRHTEYFDA